MEDSTVNLIEFWKKNPPRPQEHIPFRSVMNPLSTAFSTLEFREEIVGRWGFHKKKSAEVAIFSFAGVISQADDMETGNLVPEGEVAQERSSWRKAQCKANSWGFYTIVLDTSTDSELFELMKKLDNFVANDTAFGCTSRSRRAFMSGAEPRFNSKFWMQTPMFLPVGSDPKPQPPRHLHRWVKDADRASSLFRANPARPVLYGRRGNVPVSLAECDPNHLRAGDIVAIAFMIVYYLTEKEWYPQYQPVEVYVLKRSMVADIAAYEVSYVDRPPPTTMSYDEVEGVVAGGSRGDKKDATEGGISRKPDGERSGNVEDLYATPHDPTTTPSFATDVQGGSQKPSDECDPPGSSETKSLKRGESRVNEPQLKSASDDDLEKSSTSTMSDGNDSKVAARKRGVQRGVEGEDHEAADGNQEGKRKGRKNVRLS
ncbi:hypothetical protein GSI_12241 [Ganoderma sinense ZZ0214-1]|uniref:Uncharacterized protein n=1 Tax=Ganoderma sinense ZZ0214-1 TaxID=1077348 RepID=A0A2G8RY86_9APHY|nr:hypothetical protein GSI_12241 [Ganoderma sinense ZZ0214-1]